MMMLKSAASKVVTRPSVPARAGKTASGTAKPAKADIADYVASLPGVTAPFNNPYFDPLNLVATAKDIDEVRRWRESEVTHGRVAMLAALGFIVGEQLEDFPAFFNADGHVVGPAIYQFQQVEARGGVFWVPLVIAIGLAESYRVGLGWASPKGAAFNTIRPEGEYDMGDLGFDPLGLKPEDPEELKVMQTKELNNGRLAMIAIAAFTAEELVSKQEIFEHLFTDIEKEVVLELDDVERDIGLPVTPLPQQVVDALKN